ncbi:MAG TPA: hypothetical protein PKD64_19485 [Pirellulaceae bacterium]|nr:hypothetical protein [Pirellulaceae bacterium]HMO94375.1 hypothetical protein [Pirellulaceae bacterium]HMP71451.1 hypothetical protein [Pirellulaceae bacterium]
MTKLMSSLLAMMTATLWLVPHPQDDDSTRTLKPGEMRETPIQLPSGEIAVVRESSDGSKAIQSLTQTTGQPRTEFGNRGQEASGYYAHWNAFNSGNSRANQLGSALQSAIKSYREATGEEKSAKREDVRVELAKQYDEFLGLQQQQIDQLKERIVKLEEQLERRHIAKERMVDLKLEMTLSEAEGLGWPDSPGGTFNNRLLPSEFFNYHQVPPSSDALLAPPLQPKAGGSAPR